MALALEERAMADDILIGDTPKARLRRGRLKGAKTAGRLWKHSTLGDVRGLVPDAVLDGLRPVTLVRNPWDRMVSYYHWLQDQTFDHPAVERAKRLPFAMFLADDLVAQSFRNSSAISYVSGGCAPIFMRLEHLEEDLKPFAALLGFTPKMPVVNQSKRARDWRDYYDAASRARVADICAEDVARFGYDFDG